MTPVAGEVYLSLVVTARNDDHGGNLLGRMQAFVNGWLEQARRFDIPSELILVEWNPPADRPRLRDALRWPDPGPCEVRIVEVPPEIHARYQHAGSLALYQMIGKNVGIRRARGRFILATNIDILFSDELAAFLAGRTLERGVMYRIDRHDAMGEIPMDAGIAAQLAYCRSHLIRLNAREGTFEVTPDGQRTLAKEDLAPAGTGILFGRGWYSVERYNRQPPFRWAGPTAELLLDDAPAHDTATPLAATQSTAAHPAAGQPTAPQSAVAQPTALQFAAAQPAAPQPTAAQPATALPAPAQPAALPAPSQSAATQPALAQPAPDAYQSRDCQGAVPYTTAPSQSRLRSDPAVLHIDLEPGPATGGYPLHLEITDEDGRLLTEIPLACRNRLQLPLPAPVPRRLLFQSKNGGLSAGADPRVLNFRVFSVTIDRGATADAIKLRPIGMIARFKTLLGMVDHLIERLATGGDLVPVTVPVSVRMRNLFQRYLRLRRATPAPAPAADLAVPPLFLHTNGCGDFTLMAREHWFDLRAYPEFDLFSMNIDSLFCVAAHHGGAREVVLAEPLRIYHLEHGTGSGWTPEGQARLFARLAEKGIPFLANDDVLRWAAQMNRLDTPLIFNHENWGMAGVDLKETGVAVTASTPADPVRPVPNPGP